MSADEHTILNRCGRQQGELKPLVLPLPSYSSVFAMNYVFRCGSPRTPSLRRGCWSARARLGCGPWAGAGRGPLPRRCRFHVDPCPPVSVSCAPAPQLRLHDAASAACSGLSVCGLSVWPFAYDFLFFRLGSESQFPEFAHPEGARPAEGGERGGRGLPAPCLGTAVCCDNLSPRGFWPSGAVIAFRT